MKKIIINNLGEYYLEKMEKENQELTQKITDKEWLKIFPEAQEYCLDKKLELQEIIKDILSDIKNKLKLIDKKSSENNKWFWGERVMVWDGQSLTKAQKELGKIEYLISITKNKKNKSNKKLTKKMINQALNTSIVDVVGRHIKLKKVGKNLVGLCPFHNEKNPSFYVYPESNSFYCFGCQEGGNIINFIKKINNIDFKEAVKLLNNY
jgi:hypothetical protein